MDTNYLAKNSLDQLLPKLRKSAGKDFSDWPLFEQRLNENFERLFLVYHRLYGDQHDFFYHLESLLFTLLENFSAREQKLKDFDADCLRNPDWFLSNKMMGGVCYVDLFAKDLKGIKEKIPYFQEIGLTYLHLLPLFRSSPGNNDGGYAISSYREVRSDLGTIEELKKLASRLRENNIFLALDFVFNHTADDHEWALAAKAGDPDYQAYYHFFPDTTLPELYSRYLREIFPNFWQGNFTYLESMNRWVWTTFNNFQWDLNYRNPAVFKSMAEEMLFIANQGIQIIRMDAVAFIWKELGTSCENLPQAHWIIQAYNAIMQIVAPSILFKSEAIVHPDEVVKYIDKDECQLSYNPLLMATIWEALATRNVELLQHSAKKRFNLPNGTAWINYVRVHDDIGWTFSDEDAAELGINGFEHRRFLNEFYTGKFPGSFARGLPFQHNLVTQDMRISGTCASLAGLEKATQEETAQEIEIAIKRILMIHSIILSIGGIPLLYFGDEHGQLNNYGYVNQPDKAEDSRWVHRIKSDWNEIEKGVNYDFPSESIYQSLVELIRLRKTTEALHGLHTEILSSHNPHVFAYKRENQGLRFFALTNFSESPQIIELQKIISFDDDVGFKDLITNGAIASDKLTLNPYQYLWLVPEK